MFVQLLALSVALPTLVSGHACVWHPSMWGFNRTEIDGNRPQDPLMHLPFNGWWFHNHLSLPPNPTDFLEFPAGGSTKVEITCDKGATSYYNTYKYGKMDNPDDSVCPGSGMDEYHTQGLWDLKGTGFAIAYIPPSQVQTIRPQDFTMFTINNTSPWKRTTIYQVPSRMPACPPGGCTCAWFWIHSSLSGSQQIYMNGFQCKITGATSTVPLAQPQIARRCGADNFDDRKKPADPKNCTYGAKQPIYWLQNEGNTFFEDPWHAPYYNTLYAWPDGAQNDIFTDSVLPEMSWNGAPKTGQLKAVRGTFPSGSSNGGDVAPPSAGNPAPAPAPAPATPPANQPQDDGSTPPPSQPEDKSSNTTTPPDLGVPPAVPPSFPTGGGSNSTTKPKNRKPYNWWWWYRPKPKYTKSFKAFAPYKPKAPRAVEERSAQPEAAPVPAPVVPAGHRRSRVMRF